MLISKIEGNINFRANNKFKPQTKTQKPSLKKAVILAMGISGTIGITYFLGKNNLLGDKIYRFLNKNSNTISQASDKLQAEIQPPIYNTAIKLKEGESGYRIYQEILDNMLKDDKTASRLQEVSKTMAQDLNGVLDKIAAITDTEKIELPKDGEFLHLDIAKKRYFSLPINKIKEKSDQYSFSDPLLSQKAREEIVDLNIGYKLLEELNENSDAKLLTALRQILSSKINDKDSQFLDNCIRKMLPEDARCYGKNSVVHSSDLSHIGEIFRCALGFNVR